MNFFIPILCGLLLLTTIGENIYLRKQIDINKEYIEKLQNNIKSKIWEIKVLEEQLKK